MDTYKSLYENINKYGESLGRFKNKNRKYDTSLIEDITLGYISKLLQIGYSKDKTDRCILEILKIIYGNIIIKRYNNIKINYIQDDLFRLNTKDIKINYVILLVGLFLNINKSDHYIYIHINTLLLLLKYPKNKLFYRTLNRALKKIINFIYNVDI